jgi:phosphoglycerol transferase MdoB-like AlkP superfamily enzyme
VNRSHFDWLKPLFIAIIPMLALLSLSRMALIIWQSERIADTGGVGYIMLQGLRFDLLALAFLFLVPATLLPLICSFEKTIQPGLKALKFYFLLLVALLAFMEFATPNFIAQFDTRPNILFVEYLKHPKEILSMLIKAVPGQLIFAALSTGLIIYLMNKLITPVFARTRQGFILTAPLFSIMMLTICILLGRSTLDHRPVNPSTVAFSSDPMVNTLPYSSAYSVLYAVYEKVRYETGSEKPYGSMSESQILSEVRDSSGLGVDLFLDPTIPTLHRQQINSAFAITKPRNLVIILEESLGADYVGSLGGLDITPNLDRLSKQGIWFDHLYATGTRSVRGIEAVVTGFPPTPMRSVVKLGGSQHNFFTLAQLLSTKDYATSFIYGGEAHFDNMKRFFSNNGFETIIDENDYQNAKYFGSWGASDEDLFDKANEVFTQLNDTGKPFFSLVFTSSNHSPFDFPDDRIELYEEPKNTVANAVKYADFALGEYIQKARESAYWKDTVFLIIADHSDRVYGPELVPIEKFRIPALILNADSKPRTVSRVSSQIDMLPTLLSMIGLEADHPALGIDMTRPDLDQIPARAIMQYGSTQAYMEDQQVVILQKDLPPQQFIYQHDKLIDAVSNDQGLQRRALAHALWPMEAYKKNSYRLPSKSDTDTDMLQSSLKKNRG